MFRLVAISWKHGEAPQRDAARRLAMAVETKLPALRCVFADEGLKVYFASDGSGVARAYPMNPGAGVVLGVLFQRDAEGGSAAGDPVLDETVTNAILQTRGRALLEHFWGRYIALVRDSSDRSVLVLPDPTAECPIFLTCVDGLTVLFSQLSDITALGAVKFSINWRFVAASMLEPEPQVFETGLNEVSRVRAGVVLRIRADGTRQHVFAWDLFEIADVDPIEDFAEAAERARHVVGTCVERWASCYPKIVLLLSGGIDSSIVLASLLRARDRPEVTCLNLYDRNIGGNELQYARCAAAEIRAPDGYRSELIELERTVDSVDIKLLSQVPPAACPRPYLPESLYRRIYQRAVGPRGAAMATGFGGDYIFYRTSSARPAVDYVRRHGAGRDLLRVVRDHTGSSTYWSVLWEALSIGWSRRDLPEASMNSVQRFSSADVAARVGSLDAYLSPQWCQSAAFRNSAAVPPGKRRHIQTMYQPVQAHDTFDPIGGLQWFSPLLSQPINELFARIPTYVLKHRGVERAVARRAFARELPRPIRQRFSKCITDNFVHQVFRKHESFFREVLIDGVLVKEGLLDRRKVERFLDEAQDGYADGSAQLIGDYFDLELWLRSWQSSASAGHSHRAAPAVCLRSGDSAA